MLYNYIYKKIVDICWYFCTLGKRKINSYEDIFVYTNKVYVIPAYSCVKILISVSRFEIMRHMHKNNSLLYIFV